MDYEHPFVAEIRSNPHEDAPRLVYADFLDEAGDPQGELIRVQVALSHLAPGDPERRELELREAELLAEYADPWLAPLREVGAEGVSARSLQRGLIERVRINAAAFLQHGDELCRRAPALYCVELRRVAGHGSALQRLLLPTQITSLDLSASLLARAEVEAISRARWMEQLEVLSVAFNRLNDAAMQPLFQSAWTRLESLNLGVNHLGQYGLDGLVRRGVAPRLAALNLALNDIRDFGLERLAGSPLASGLKELDLGSTGVTSAGLARLVGSPILQSLERLVVRGNPLGQGSEEALAALAAAPRLTHLDLRGTHRSVPRSGYGSDPVAPPDALVKRLGDGLLW